MSDTQEFSLGADRASTIAIPDLDHPVEVWRDRWGVPHIDARTDADAFAALGFVHAQERLWQMESFVRKGTGHWAEWVGADGVASDRLARMLQVAAVAQADHDRLGDEARTMLAHYARGVNSYIATGASALEYRLLKTSPQPWLPWHSIVAMRQIGFLLGGVWMKLLRAVALPILGPERAAMLRYDNGGNERTCMPWDGAAQRWPMDLEALRPAIAELIGLADAAAATGGGSNNWAIGGALTSHGHPILMGDPHRELDVPAIYMQAHFKGATFDAIGATVPGVPGLPHFGHNRRVAWGVTVAFVDHTDFFIEQFRDFGREYRTATGWAPTGRRSEIVRVREGADVILNMFETAHGAVVIGDPARGGGLSLQSAQLSPDDQSFDCLLRMLRAGTVPELHEASRGWGLIDHNLVAVDTAGNIGHRVRARVPKRPRANGWLPVPAWLEAHAWDGFVPFEDMPAQLNPPGHRIVTANNRVTDDRDTPYLSTDCHPPYRASRIAKRLDELSEYSVDTMAPIFADSVSEPAMLFVERLRGLDPAPLTAGARRLWTTLCDWDAVMRADSLLPTAYAQLRLVVTRRVAARSGLLQASQSSLQVPQLGEAGLVTHFWWVVPTLLRGNDTSFLAGATWADVLHEALEACALAPESLAANWSEVHTPAPRHPLSKLFPEAASLLDTTCDPIGGDGDTVLATGYLAGESLRASYSSLLRYAFDMGDLGNCRWIAYQGVSGCAGSPHRNDQNADWAAVRMVPMLIDWCAIRAGEGHRREMLVPSPRTSV